MTTEPVDRFSGEPLSEWMETVPNELEVDAIGLWQIIPALRHDYGLTGDELDDAIRKMLGAVLARGARPVRSSSKRHNAWEEVQYEGRNDIVEAVIDEWKQMERDPDVGDVWFVLPEFIST